MIKGTVLEVDMKQRPKVSENLGKAASVASEQKGNDRSGQVMKGMWARFRLNSRCDGIPLQFGIPGTDKICPPKRLALATMQKP